MRTETRRFLHDIVAEVFGLPKNKVIWSQQNGEKQAVPLVTLRAYSHQAEAREEIRLTADPGILDLRTPTAFVLEVRYFGKSGSYPVDIVDNFVRCLEKPTVVDKCFVNGVALLYADPVQDITSLLGNGQQYEPAAAVDLHCRYTAQTIDDPGYIDEVDAVIDVEGGVEITGKLIHGNLIRGEEPDLTGALDVDFTASAKDK